MLTQILTHTPTWVFILFFVLVALGYSQSKRRTVSRPVVLVLPVAMTAFSLYGLLSAFSIAPLPIIAWVAALGVVIFVGRRLNVPRDVTYSPESRRVTVPGSWAPLALMMGIFFVRYFVAVAIARQAPIVSEPLFTEIVAAAYGAFCGAFVSRAAVMYRAGSVAVRT